jgi:hypothetical protein
MAQEGGFNPGSISGSVGSLVAAAMQTAGVFAQSRLLANFEEGLKTLAALCYIFAIIGAIFSCAIFGNYSRALYFLVGPTLFFFMVNVTDTVQGTEQRFGNRQDGSIADQKRMLQGFVNTADYSTAKVSSFFLVWDKLVSSVTQGIVEQIVKAGEKEDIIVKAREQYFSWIVNYTPSDEGYKMLVQQSLMGLCGERFAKLWELRRYRSNPLNRSIQGNLTEAGTNKKQEYDKMKAQKDIPVDPTVRKFAMAHNDVSEDFFRDAETSKVSCEDVWNAVSATSRTEARRLLSSPQTYLRYTQDFAGIPYDRVRDEVRKTLEQEGHGSAEDILAGYILKNTMRDAWIMGNYSNVTSAVPDKRESSTNVFSQAEMSSSFGGLMRLVHFAKAIPYIQGLILYILSISFPFFAVFLVMPGRSRSFLVWMSLWVWVKSWDIGFALVSVARKFMWSFVRGGVDRYAPGNVFGPKVQPQSDFNWSQPETILSVIFDNDPNSALNLYFTVIGLLTVSVPILSAHFCLGATNMFGIFSMAIDQVGNKWATQAKKMAHRLNVGSPTERFADEYKALGRLAAMGGAVLSLFKARNSSSFGVKWLSKENSPPSSGNK